MYSQARVLIYKTQRLPAQGAGSASRSGMGFNEKYGHIEYKYFYPNNYQYSQNIIFAIDATSMNSAC